MPLKPVFRGMGVDLLGALRIVADELAGHTLDLEQPLARIKHDLVTDLAHIMGKLVAINLACDDLFGEHRARLEARHAIAVQMVGHVENDDVGMKLRIEFAARIFGEAREQQAPGGLVDDFTLDPAAKLGMFLEIGERDPDRSLMGGKDTLVARHQRQDRDRLGGTDVEVPAGVMLDAVLAAAAELLVADLAAEQFLELLGVDLARQAEADGELAAPFGRLVAALGVIIANLIIARDIGRRTLEATGMDHAGFAFSRGPSARPWLASDTRMVPRTAPSRGTGVATTLSSSGGSEIGAPSPFVSGSTG